MSTIRTDMEGVLAPMQLQKQGYRLDRSIAKLFFHCIVSYVFLCRTIWGSTSLCFDTGLRSELSSPRSEVSLLGAANGFPARQ
jgi:hypothetical protein